MGHTRSLILLTSCALTLMACSGGGANTASAPATPPAAPPTLVFTVTDVAVKGGSTGAIRTTINGGTAPFTFAWSNGASTQDLANLGSGVYILTITDAHGQKGTWKAAVADPTQVKDVDANLYETVVIGSQTWLASNVRCTRTPAGVAIASGLSATPSRTVAYLFTTASTTGGAQAEANPVFYNWAGAQAVCLPGWHIPSEQEWEALDAYLSVEGQGGAGTNVATKLLGSATPSGFDGLLTGYWDPGLSFDRGSYAAYWSSTQYPNDSRDMWQIRLDTQGLRKTYLDKVCGFSVRLVKD